VGLHKGTQRGHHRRRLGFVSLERLDLQRKPGGVGEQADGDLRFQTTFLGEAGFMTALIEIPQ
jgi:hypothetical protein